MARTQRRTAADSSPDRTLRFLKDLVDAHGAPGFEGPVARVMERHLAGIGTFSRDRLGSFICEKRGTSDSPRVMLGGHLDEVGFMVRSITKEGFIRFLPLGGTGPTGIAACPLGLGHQLPIITLERFVGAGQGV